MTDLLEFALTKIRVLPADRQDQAARAILDVAEGAEESVYQLSDEERAAIEAGRADIAQGRFASEADIRSLLAKYRS